jgi:hypothetical protein
METKKIIITGDVSLDKNIYMGERKFPEDNGYGTQISEVNGGSHFLFTLIKELSNVFNNQVKIENTQIDEKIENDVKINTIEKQEKKEKEYWNNYQVNFGLNENIFDSKGFPDSLKTFVTWNKRKDNVPEEFQKTLGKEINSWKVDEPLGFGAKKLNDNNSNLLDFYSKHSLKVFDIPSILVFDDGGNNFRNYEKIWSNLLDNDTENSNRGKIQSVDRIILKTAYPLGHGKLFQNLTTKFKEKLIIIASIDEIRKENVLISKGVSWEQTALDLVFELQNNPSIKMLLNCKYLIVNLQSEGVLFIEIDNKEIKKCRLIFDPKNLEGEWIKESHISGGVIGLMSCFTAAIVYGCMEKDFNIESTITRALSAIRGYKIIGHGKDENNPRFNFESICSEIINPNSQFASAFVPIPSGIKKANEFLTQNWTILEGNYKPTINKKAEPLFDTAFRFALNGNNELANTPFLKINNLTTYDRREIEALRNIKNLISDYLNEEKPEKPLSLAVFGMPGSGKSFAVKQLAKSLNLPILEFNLSQFVEGELEGAFHQVRDKVLEGTPPIVFWDEFDSQAYKWLQYLLAPMQDGKFQAGQIIHPIGKSIFIFAGGTSYTFETFGINKPQKPKTNNSIAIKEYELTLNGYTDFNLKKGPDFKSRLSGYLNIQGPNQLEMLDKDGRIMKDAKGNTVYNEDDIQYPVRRALFIRGICRLKDYKELNIDHGLLHALIKTRKFTHGSRSLEKILSYLKSKNSDKLQRSNLPTHSILNMLVDNDFIALLDNDKFFEFQAFKIAPKIHQNWMKIADKEGWKLEFHKDYNFLPSHLKDENIAAARRIQEILNALKPIQNLKIVPLIEAEFYEKAEFDKTIKDPKLMEKMAIVEHKGWVNTKLEAGWDFGKPRNDDKKLHDCIIGWKEIKKLKDGNKVILSEKDKNKDKDAIKNYPDVLVAAEFVIVKEKL